MSAVRASGKRRGKEAEAPRPEKKKRGEEEEEFDPDLSNDFKSIISALHQIKEKAKKDGQKKNEETISSVASDIKSMLDEAKSKLEKDRQTFVKALSKSSKEWESSLKNESAKFEVIFDKFCKEKASHHQALKEIFNRFDEEKKKLFTRYEQQRKKDKTMLSELEITCADKIAAAEESLKKKKQDDKCFSLLRKSLGSFLETGSDEDFPSDD